MGYQQRGFCRIRKYELHQLHDSGILAYQMTYFMSDDKLELIVIKPLDQPGIQIHDMGLVLLQPGYRESVQLRIVGHVKIDSFIKMKSLQDLPDQPVKPGCHSGIDLEAVSFQNELPLIFDFLNLGFLEYRLDDFPLHQIVEVIAELLFQFNPDSVVIHVFSIKNFYGHQ